MKRKRKEVKSKREREVYTIYKGQYYFAIHFFINNIIRLFIYTIYTSYIYTATINIK